MLIAAAGLPVLVAVWLLLSPGRLFSREMTWDLLFNIAGAWHLHNGHVPHVDFHDPLGALSFVLTDIGLYLIGNSVFAFLIGVQIVLALVFSAATMVAVKRLPFVAALIFVLYVSLLVLMPSNVGDPVTAYSFAMAYNRYGWSIAAILFLALFLPPRYGTRSPIGEAALALLLLVVLYYLKITYFLAALGGLAVALVISDHIRGNARLWIAVWCLAASNAIAPYNFPYLRDIWDAVAAGDIRGDLRDHVVHFLQNGAEHALFLSQILVLVWLWMRRRAAGQVPLAAGFLIIAGVFLLSQNAQSAQVPLYIVIACLLYDALSRAVERSRSEEARLAAPLLAAVFVFPMLSIGGAYVGLAGYHAKATSASNDVFEIERTNLRGLRVPAEQPGLLEAFATGQVSYELFNRTRAIKPRYELTQFEYAQTLLDAASALAGELGSHPKIVVLDQVNPLPFILGLEPPSGGNLWYGPGLAWRPAEQVFADAEFVLIPKFSTYGTSTSEALRYYGATLARSFSVYRNTPAWIIMKRGGQAVDAGPEAPSVSGREADEKAALQLGKRDPD